MTKHRPKQFVLDTRKAPVELTISDLEKMTFPVYNLEHPQPQRRIGQMSIRQFLEKFG